MHLGSSNPQIRNYDKIRPLSVEEAKKHEELRPIIVEARDRLSLFRMLERNYQDWRHYLNRVLSADFRENGVDMTEELNRLILNYLTTAYTAQTHFATSLRQRFGPHSQQIREYREFLKRLETKSWEFSFFRDYRGYVQHAGLAVESSHRVMDHRSIQLTVAASAKNLIRDGKSWKRSRLTEANGDIDLIETLRRFHVDMFESYAVHVVKAFFPELQAAADFYANLTKEVHVRDRGARMIFFEKEPVPVDQPDGSKSWNFTAIEVPNNLYAEFGIKLERV